MISRLTNLTIDRDDFKESSATRKFRRIWTLDRQGPIKANNEFTHRKFHFFPPFSFVCSCSILNLFRFHGNFSEYNSHTNLGDCADQTRTILNSSYSSCNLLFTNIPIVILNEYEISNAKFQSRVPDGDPRAHSNEKFPKLGKLGELNDALRDKREFIIVWKSAVYNCI